MCCFFQNKQIKYRRRGDETDRQLFFTLTGPF